MHVPFSSLLFAHFRIVVRRTIERYSHDILGRHLSDRIYTHNEMLKVNNTVKMNSIRLQLEDLPIEIPLIIFRKLHNAKPLDCLFDTNQWLNEILCHPILISRLNLLEFDSIDSISPLPQTVHLSVDYQRLKKITNNFRRNAMTINCSKIHYLAIGQVPRYSKYLEQYFPRAHLIRH